MRFSWMVGNQVTISVSGKAWRPPDYITSPTVELSKQIENNEQSEGETITTEIDNRPSDEVQQIIKLGSRKRAERVNKKSSRRWQKVLSDKCLPFPPTHIENNRHRFHSFLRPRVVALFAAVMVAFSILIGLTVLFSETLDEVASKMDRATGGDYSKVDSPLIQSNGTQRRRKLLTIDAEVRPHPVQMQLPHSTIMKAISTLYSSAEAVHRIMRVLLKGQHFAITAAVLHNVPHLNEPSPARPTRPADEKELRNRPHSLHDETLRMYRDLIVKQLHTPLQIPQSEQRSSHRTFDVDSSTLYQSDMRSVDSMSRAPSTAREKNAHKRNELAFPQHSSSVLHSHALTVIGDIGPSGKPGLVKKTVDQMDLRESESHRVGDEFRSANAQAQVYNDIEPEAQNSLLKLEQSRTVPTAVQLIDKTEVDRRKAYGRQTLYMNNVRNGSFMLPEKIEVRQLPGGKSLCRLFNIGYLPDGALVLPKWMKKHLDFLIGRCGIKHAFFAINRIGETTSPALDEKILQAEGLSKFNVDASNTERDLFGASAPRNHMPHFVSDIFFHLVVCEALLGSGKQLLRSIALVPTDASKVEGRSIPNFPDLKPAMFLQDDTWSRPPAEWVPRLAQFFRHPEIDFKFLRRNGKNMETDGLSAEAPVITMFRSVVLSNLKSHEPFGLFGANGTNIVFEANGITRDPAWKTRGMQEQPCRVSVTVLTRQGPRALLRLKELQNRVELLGKLARIHTDIKIVDFGGIPFDEQVRIMQETNVLVATHGAGNANFIFMRPSAAVIEVFPFAYKAGPFDRFAEIFGLEYKTAMSAPQSDVFKECMNRHETNQSIKRLVFAWWDKAVAEEKIEPWVHRLELEKEFGEPGKSEGMTTRGCVRLQELEFNIDAISRMVISLGSSQCALSSQARHRHPLQSSINSI